MPLRPLLASFVSTVLLLAGCAGLEVYDAEPARTHRQAREDSAARECTALFHALDAAVEAAGVGDAGATRIAGFPYLRTDRFLASFVDEVGAREAFQAWTTRLGTLDDAGRSAELANLPAGAKARFLDDVAARFRGDPMAATRDCRAELARVDLAEQAGRERLRLAVVVPPDYQQWKRALGLYPLTRMRFARGIERWKAETEKSFAEGQAPRGRPVAYASAAAQGTDVVARVLARAASDPLGIPEPRPDELPALFAAFAPDIVVDEVDADDRIGALEYGAGGALTVDAGRPTVYTRVSYTRFEDRVLLQLDYSFWFPARPLESPGDLLGGFLDGLIWRVTLAPDGEPLVFDTIHNCGCYHLFIPTARVAVLPQPDSLDETVFAPQQLPRMSAQDRVTLRLASHTHYLEGAHVGRAFGAERKPYAMASDDDLRSLPLRNAQRASAFGPDGIVRGTERGERWFFWPTGVRNPGAMRQWGRHATSFVGMRHFDDPDLFEQYFRTNE